MFHVKHKNLKLSKKNVSCETYINPLKTGNLTKLKLDNVPRETHPGMGLIRIKLNY